MHIGSNLVPLAQYMIARLYMQAVEDQGRAETELRHLAVESGTIMSCWRKIRKQHLCYLFLLAHSKGIRRSDQVFWTGHELPGPNLHSLGFANNYERG